MAKHATDRAPLGNPITSADVGALATFLASDGAAAITGQTIHVDGGYSMMGE
jgi:enoyl-[acyl-carrier protein] reductase I